MGIEWKFSTIWFWWYLVVTGYDRQNLDAGGYDHSCTIGTNLQLIVAMESWWLLWLDVHYCQHPAVLGCSYVHSYWVHGFLFVGGSLWLLLLGYWEPQNVFFYFFFLLSSLATTVDLACFYNPAAWIDPLWMFSRHLCHSMTLRRVPLRSIIPVVICYS